MLPTDPKARKERPITRGVLDYFPDAIAAVANVSYVGNEQHNPGEDMHWARDKSNDHADCIARHLLERGSEDDDGLLHTAKLAWRALALLQLEIEARPPQTHQAEFLTGMCAAECCGEQPPPIAVYSVDEITHDEAKSLLEAEQGSHVLITHPNGARLIGFTEQSKTVYIAGPMRGYANYNFDAFDTARDDFIGDGWDAISPADIDRGMWGFDPLESAEAMERATAIVNSWTKADLHDVIRRDVDAILSSDALALLPGWEKSTGAVAEFFVARWAGLSILDAETGRAYEKTPDVRAIANSIIDYMEETD